MKGFHSRFLFAAVAVDERAVDISREIAWYYFADKPLRVWKEFLSEGSFLLVFRKVELRLAERKKAYLTADARVLCTVICVKDVYSVKLAGLVAVKKFGTDLLRFAQRRHFR